MVTVILTVSTIGLWYFAGVQSGDMKNSLVIAEQAARAAADAAKASDKQARIAEETAERQLRAYVFICEAPRYGGHNSGPEFVCRATIKVRLSVNQDETAPCVV